MKKAPPFLLIALWALLAMWGLTVHRFAQAQLSDAQSQDNACDQKPPVILIHGTFANIKRTFSTLAPLLKSRGYCVFGMNYGAVKELPGMHATADMTRSAEELAQFIRQILTDTRQNKVTLVGHSQGGTLAFYLANRLGLAENIEKIVAIAPSIRGTQVANWAPVQGPCLACTQQSSQSDFIRSLANGGFNPHGLKTLVMATENDRVVVPWQMQLIEEPMVENVIFQRRVANVHATHSGIMRNTDAMQFVADWLDGP
jgi:triacylglycerol lipase